MGLIVRPGANVYAGLRSAQSAHSLERLFQVPGRRWVHGLVAADVVLARDRGVAVPEQFGCELEAANLIDRSSCGPPKPVWCDVGDTCSIHDVTELPSDVVRRMRGTDAGREQQRVRVREPDPLQPRPDRAERKTGKCDPAHRAGRLRMVLPMRRLPFPADDGAAYPHCRDRRVKIEIPETDREHLTDTGRGAEQHLYDLTELPVRARAGYDFSLLPRLDTGPDRCDLFPGVDVRSTNRTAQARDVIHRIARQDLMADREGEREAEDDARLPGTVVALLRELLEEVVAARDTDLAKRDLLEEREHEGSHVPLVQEPGGSGEPIFELHVFQPIGDERRERAVRGHAREARLEEVPLRELLLQGAFGCGVGVGGDLDVAALAVPVTVSRAGDVSLLGGAGGRDDAEGADRGARSSHEVTPPRSGRDDLVT